MYYPVVNVTVVRTERDIRNFEENGKTLIYLLLGANGNKEKTGVRERLMMPRHRKEADGVTDEEGRTD